MIPSSILVQITLHAPTKFRELLAEAERRLLASWEAAVEEAAIHEAKPKLKVSLSAVVDLNEDEIEYAITFGGRHKLSVTESLEDPRQLELPDVARDGSRKRKTKTA
jgi:hypothetical protein